MKKIAVVTVARSDYGIYFPLLEKAKEYPDLNLELLVTGMHFSELYGKTIEEIRKDGFSIAKEVDIFSEKDTPLGISETISKGVSEFSKVFESTPFDAVMLLGDRYEMLSAAIATIPYNLPLIHLHGGELTYGAFDDVIRHSLTKMSHLHFTSTPAYRKRVIQMGEHPSRVFCSGAPGLDHLSTLKLLSADELEKTLGISLKEGVCLVTYHPVTREADDLIYQVEQLLMALQFSGRPLVFTAPNADTHGKLVLERIEDFVSYSDNAVLVKNLGTKAYFSLMKHAAVMVGNSSSGIIEAASFGLPVVNIGNRQKGRVTGKNVIHCGYSSSEITEAIESATSHEFRNALQGMKNLYGAGGASQVILEKLNAVHFDKDLLMKEFYDLNFDCE